MTTILITDGLLRKSLSLTRSLGKRGFTVYTAERTRCTPSAFSKYCKGSLRSPDPGKQPEAYAQWLMKTLREKKIDLLIPSDDHAIEIVLKHREQIEQLTTCLLPPTESYWEASDKYTTMRLAERAGVPHPKTRWPLDLAEVERIAGDLEYPVVIKPRKSSGSRGIRIVQSREELLATYPLINGQYPRPMLQEYIPAGERYDVCLLYDLDGIPRSSFVQKEVRHYPVEIGPSTLQESVWMPELVEQCKQLLAEVPWQGIVEIEFMRDPRDGVPKLMEINPRWWNSLEMAVQAGVDFPYGFYQVAMGLEVSEIHQYEIGRQCRNLLPSEILHWLANPKRREMNPPLLSIGNPRLRDDIWSWDDPLATVGFAAGVARLLFDPHVWKMMFSR